MNPVVYEAAASGDMKILNREDMKKDIFQVTKERRNNVLHIAVQFKQVEFCKKILMISGSFSSLLLKSNSRGETPLHVAANIGCSEVAKLFIDFAKEQQRHVERGEAAALSKLLRMVNVDNDTALHVAVRNGHFEISKCLLEVDQVLLVLLNKANASPLGLAIEGGFSRIASFFLENFPNSLDEALIDIKTALRSAIINSHHDIVKLLLKKEPDPSEERDQIGWTPLHYAALCGDLKTTQLLLKGNIQAAYIVDQEGTSALHVATFRGHIDVVDLLVHCCPDLHEVTDNKGRTLLHVAVISGQEKMIGHILDTPRLLGVVNEKDDEGNTALHLAVLHKRDRIVALLAQNRQMEGAAMNQNLFTAYDIFSLQPRKLSHLLVAKIHNWLGGTRGVTALQEWVSTNLKREMIGKTPEEEDEMNILTTLASDETENRRSRHEIHLLIATLIATVTFQAAFTMPGGYKDDDANKGTAQFIQKAAFRAFVIFNSIAFIFSIATVYIQLSTSKLSNSMRSRYASLTEVMIFIAILGMLIAYASGMYVVLATSIGLRLMAYIMVGCFLLVYSACWYVDPMGIQIPGLQKSRKYLRDLLFHYGII